MQYSHSRAETFEKCPYKFKLHYLDELEALPDIRADNALFLGTALHTGIEKDAKTAIKEYYENFPVITDECITEAMKLEVMIEKARKMCPEGKHEVLLDDPDFKGFIDLLVPVGKYEYDIYDFKYSNNVQNYMDSDQLHLYKYYFEKLNVGQHIRNMYFLIVPKTTGKKLNNEELTQYRNRMVLECMRKEPELIKIEYDPKKVIQFLTTTKHSLECVEYKKNKSFLCNYCDYKDFCERGIDYMILPSSERRTVKEITKTKTWIYGSPFSGKTTMLDAAPNPLNLNTDGNVQFVTMPVLPIKDEITTNGRMTNRKYAWEVFKEAISELEKGQNDFETIIVDLIEDTREACRLYKYDEMGIQHESDSGYGKGWDIIKTEYLSTIRRLFNLPYKHIVVVSHQVEGEVKKSNGTTISTFKPNMQEALANKIAGMVDIVARVVVKDDGTRTLNFKSNEYVFGGGRLTNIQQTEIPLDWDELMNVYKETLKKVPAPVKKTAAQKPAEPEEIPAAEILLKDDVTLVNGDDIITLRGNVDTVNYMQKLVSEGYKINEEPSETVEEEPMMGVSSPEPVQEQEETPKTRTRRRRS